MKLPSEIPFDRLVALVDTREQTPLDLSPLASVKATLATGDYSDSPVACPRLLATVSDTPPAEERLAAFGLR